MDRVTPKEQIYINLITVGVVRTDAHRALHYIRNWILAD